MPFEKKPILAITMGDPAGIGAEIIVKSLSEALQVCRPVLIGFLRDFEKAAGAYTPPELAARLGRSIPVHEPEEGPGAGKLSESARGEAQGSFIRAAVRMALDAEVEGIVTAPISKAAFRAAGIPHAGHTEMLAELTGAPTPVMMLAGPKLRVVPLTVHCPLSQVPALLTRELVETKIRILHEDLGRFFALPEPRIALCALNPHAGEGGLFGAEEGRVLIPAVKELKSRGIRVSGPFPADTIFRRAAAGEFDVVAAPSHDQALIPLKLLHFDEGVNITLGLPIIRTSPDHGTARDIAGRGIARPASMIAAIRTAAEMARRV